jgi:hypothetical protein
MRYHKEVYAPPWWEKEVGDLVKKINSKEVRWTEHSEDKLFDLPPRLRRNIIKFITCMWIDTSMVFEVYRADSIYKFCLRVQSPISNNDMVVVMTSDKKVVTFYFNRTEDMHSNLNEEVYEREEKCQQE